MSRRIWTKIGLAAALSAVAISSSACVSVLGDAFAGTVI